MHSVNFCGVNFRICPREITFFSILIYSMMLLCVLSLSFHPNVCECICELALPIRRLNRNSEDNNNNSSGFGCGGNVDANDDKKRSQWEIVYAYFRWQEHCFFWLPNFALHPFGLSSFSGFAGWHIAVLPFQLVIELKMSARLR